MPTLGGYKGAAWSSICCALTHAWFLLSRQNNLFLAAFYEVLIEVYRNSEIICSKTGL